MNVALRLRTSTAAEQDTSKVGDREWQNGEETEHSTLLRMLHTALLFWEAFNRRGVLPLEAKALVCCACMLMTALQMAVWACETLQQHRQTARICFHRPSPALQGAWRSGALVMLLGRPLLLQARRHPARQVT